MRRIATVLLLMSLLFLVVPSALAQGESPSRIAPQELTFFTPYPSQELAVGENVTLALTLRTGSDPEIVKLETQNLPEGWTASFKGGGRVVEAAYVEPENDTKIDLRIDPPKDVKAGNYNFTVLAHGENGEELKLPIQLTVTEKLPPNLTLNVDLPTLRGAPDTSFNYNATLKNEGDTDLTINLAAETPQGFTASFKLTGQDVTSIPLAAGESKRINVEVKGYSDIPEGSYPIGILAQGGEAQATTQLTAEVVGQPELTVTGPEGRLSDQAYIGNVTPVKVIVQNTGTGSVRNISLTATQPAGWEVQFEPKQIAEIQAGKQVEVTANIKPAEQAIAGDYVVTVNARPEDGPAKSAEYRITVLTSTLWGMAGIGLIAVAVGVVALAVMRFGRR